MAPIPGRRCHTTAPDCCVHLAHCQPAWHRSAQLPHPDVHGHRQIFRLGPPAISRSKEQIHDCARTIAKPATESFPHKPKQHLYHKLSVLASSLNPGTCKLRASRREPWPWTIVRMPGYLQLLSCIAVWQPRPDRPTFAEAKVPRKAWSSPAPRLSSKHAPLGAKLVRPDTASASRAAVVTCPARSSPPPAIPVYSVSVPARRALG